MTELNQSDNADVPPTVAMLQMISGFWIARAIYIAAKLGIADHLRRGDGGELNRIVISAGLGVLCRSIRDNH